MEDASFAENFTANDWKLSADYEKNLSFKAQAYVDKYAEEVLHDIRKASRGRCNATPHHQSVGCGVRMANPFSLEGYENVVTTSPTPSTTSDDEHADQILGDGYRLHASLSSPSRDPVSRQYSSSPTTSFSNDFVNGTNNLDDEISECSIPAVKASNVIHRNGQQRRSKRAKYLATQRPRSISTTLFVPNQISL